MNDKELEERKEEIKNSNSNIPICVVYDVTITDDSYLLKVVFNKKDKKGDNVLKTIKLKKSFFSKGTTLNGKTLTGKLYLLFKIKKYSKTDAERNIKLFLVLKKIGVVTKHNKIDVNKFKGIVFQVKGNNTSKIKNNPNYILRYDYLFNGESPSVVNYHTNRMFNEKGYEKDYREFRKADKKKVKELKDDVTKEQKQKVNKVTNGLDRVIKDGYKGENTETDCDALIEDFLTVASRSELKVKHLSITNLSKIFCGIIKQIDEQNRIIDKLKNKVSNLENKVDKQDRIIRKQNKRIDELEKKLDRLENR
jgi:hypothetical protein